MNILGIGPLELFLIVVIMLVVLGPKDTVKQAQQAGRLIRKVIQSPAWKSMMDASREIREIPTRFVQESGMGEDLAELRRQTGNTLKPLIEPAPIPKVDLPTAEAGFTGGETESDEPRLALE